MNKENIVVDALDYSMYELVNVLLKQFCPKLSVYPFSAEDANCGRYRIFLRDTIGYILADKTIDFNNVLEEIVGIIKASKFGATILREYICMDEIADDASIRRDFKTALESVSEGRYLSHRLGYGFSKIDIKKLAKLHRDNICRDKIEDLLTDCNFHCECSKFSAGKYDEFLA